MKLLEYTHFGRLIISLMHVYIVIGLSQTVSSSASRFARAMATSTAGSDEQCCKHVVVPTSESDPWTWPIS